MCMPSSTESFVLHTYFDILHAIAKLIRASHCIAANSDHFEVFAVSFVLML